MVTIQIPEELDAELQQAADRLGRTKIDFLSEAICARIAEEFAAEPLFTDEQIARMRHSIAQLDRGETISGEQIDRKFEAWRRQRTDR